MPAPTETTPWGIPYVDPDVAKVEQLAVLVNAMSDALNDALTQVANLNPTGSIRIWTTDAAPVGHLICNGAAVSRTTYADLYAVIGTAFGTGDGSTTFNLPDLRGRVPVGRDSGQTEFDSLNESGGAKTHTLTIAEMPRHNHLGNTKVLGGGTTGAFLRVDGSSYGLKDLTPTGGGGAHNNLQPYRVINFIIKAVSS